MVENFGGLLLKYILVEEILADKLFVQQISLDKYFDGYNFWQIGCEPPNLSNSYTAKVLY